MTVTVFMFFAKALSFFYLFFLITVQDLFFYTVRILRSLLTLLTLLPFLTLLTLCGLLKSTFRRTPATAVAMVTMLDSTLAPALALFFIRSSSKHDLACALRLGRDGNYWAEKRVVDGNKLPWQLVHEIAHKSCIVAQDIHMIHLHTDS